LTEREEKAALEVRRLLHAVRDLERENAMLKDRVKKDDGAMVTRRTCTAKAE
jgi:hypothetical protein